MRAASMRAGGSEAGSRERRELRRLRRASRIGTAILALATLALGTTVLHYAKLGRPWPKSLAAYAVLYVCLQGGVLALLHRWGGRAERHLADGP